MGNKLEEFTEVSSDHLQRLDGDIIDHILFQEELLSVDSVLHK